MLEINNKTIEVDLPFKRTLGVILAVLAGRCAELFQISSENFYVYIGMILAICACLCVADINTHEQTN